MTMTIFETEERIIQKIQTLLDEERHQENPLLPELTELLKHYERMYKQLRHVISLSDRQQLRLNELNHQLSESNARKDKFFSIIAHDLRSPLSSLIGLNEVLQEQIRADASKSTIEMTSDQIYLSTKNLYTLLENLLTWSQIQRGTLSYKAEQLDLSETCRFALRLFHSQVQQKHLRLINEIPQGLQVETDYNMLSTILRNLISNAIKFTPSGGQITLSARDFGKESIAVCIADTGIGISEKDRQKLFRLDQSYSGTGTAGEKGTGLGLSLCKEFIDQAGQAIWVESEIGRGTSFYFTLLRSSAHPENNPYPNPKRAQQDFSHYRMLVVDDVPANRQSLIDFLRPFGFRFREAGNAREAFTIWKQWQPQIVWMDIRMPVMDGYEGARQIRASEPHGETTLIALTASIPEEEYPRVLEAGYNSLLRKPFDSMEVLGILEQNLDLALNARKVEMETPTLAPPPTDLQAEDFAELSEEFLERLDYVAKVFDMNVAHKLVNEMRQQYPRQAEGLANLINEFSFDRLQKLLDEYRAL